MFKLTSDYLPIDEQEKAARGLVKGIEKKYKGPSPDRCNWLR
ncbi:MAG: hypothetical protein UZ21_OP11001000752 [Microgenomates bacterium OLB22]|nr:MAG: hypothetical protein UZ21_OP11001000752 [Microgenomates bacterium OLB22]